MALAAMTAHFPLLLAPEHFVLVVISVLANSTSVKNGNNNNNDNSILYLFAC
jgi:hypothetical protein